jgi:two-component system, response regulator PdtaR
MKVLRVLLVEDDVLIAMLLTEMMRSMGHNIVAIATTERAAIEAAGRYKPDLMIVDARLSEGSGISAVQTILRAGPMPHVFISGGLVNRPPPDAVMLRKPFTENELVQAVRRAV